MAQAWHNSREQLALDRGVEAGYWRASKYRVSYLGDTPVLEAAPNAVWKRFRPFDSYTPASNAREVKAGPHLMFLRLKHVYQEQEIDFYKALSLFAKEYGLLGVFQEDNWQYPILPFGKYLIAPEALIDDQGRLRRVDPATDGTELLADQLRRRNREVQDEDRVADSSVVGVPPDIVALPSEVKFGSLYSTDYKFWWNYNLPPQPPSWKKSREDYGALLILDEEVPDGVSVLCTREPIYQWERTIRRFPSSDTLVESLVNGEGHWFNRQLQTVSPRVFLGEDGSLERGWHCHNLLQAMYTMLYLDLTGGNTIKKCGSWGCSNYFRLGAQSKSRYCSQKCANRASTRMTRGQKP